MKRLFNILSTVVLLINLYVVAHRYAYPGVAIDRQYAYFQAFLIIPSIIAIVWLTSRLVRTKNKWAVNIGGWLLKHGAISTILIAALLFLILKIAAFLIKEI